MDDLSIDAGLIQRASDLLLNDDTLIVASCAVFGLFAAMMFTQWVKQFVGDGPRYDTKVKAWATVAGTLFSGLAISNWYYFDLELIACVSPVVGFSTFKVRDIWVDHIAPRFARRVRHD